MRVELSYEKHVYATIIHPKVVGIELIPEEAAEREFLEQLPSQGIFCPMEDSAGHV